MRRGGGHGPQRLPLLQQRDQLGRKRRKCREPAAEAGNDQQPPLRRQPGVGGEEGDREADDIAPSRLARRVPGGSAGKRLLNCALSPQRSNAPRLAPTQTAAMAFHI